MHRSVDVLKSPRQVAPNLEQGEAPALCSHGVYGPVVDAASTRMDDMVSAAGDGAPRPFVVDVDVQRRVDADRRMQTRGRLPGSEANAGDELPVVRCRLEWDSAAVADQLVAAGRKPGEAVLSLRIRDGCLRTAGQCRRGEGESDPRQDGP